MLTYSKFIHLGGKGVEIQILNLSSLFKNGNHQQKNRSIERLLQEYGWGNRTRTYEWRDQNPLPYQLGYTPIWCGRRDLNSHAVKHWNLNPACLPIPPLPQCRRPIKDNIKVGGYGEIRTCDPIIMSDVL